MSTDHIVSLKVYIGVFLALLVLTFVTVQVAFVDLGALNFVVAMTIAVIKGVLVVLYFMHVRYGNRVIWVVVIAGFFWLGIMLALTLSDYFSRGWLPVYS